MERRRGTTGRRKSTKCAAVKESFRDCREKKLKMSTYGRGKKDWKRRRARDGGGGGATREKGA